MRTLRIFRFIFLGLIFIGGGIFSFHQRLSRVQIKNKTDLAFITGQLKDSSFNGSSFKINGYLNLFNVNGDFVNFFDPSSFKKLKGGDTLVLAISKSDVPHLDKTDLSNLVIRNNTLDIYSLSHGQSVYLDYNKAIKEHNDPDLLISGAMILILGVVCVYFGSKAFKKEAASSVSFEKRKSEDS